jgi:hypothetical protein
MEGRALLEIPIHLNPTATTARTHTLIFTETGFRVKEVPDLAAGYGDIVSVEKKSWWLVNSLIHVRFNTPSGERKIFFTAARGMAADEAGNRKGHQDLLDAMGRGAVDSTSADPALKRHAEESRMNWLWGKIQTRGDALKVVKHVANAFIGVAVIVAVIGVFLSPYMLIDAALYGALGALLKYTRHRIFAMLLFLISAIAFFTTLSNMVNPEPEGGKNIMLSVMILWASIRAVQATNRLDAMGKNV